MKEDNHNSTELTNIDKNNLEINEKSEVKEKITVTFTERMRSYVNFLTVEPYLLCYILPSAISFTAVQQINLEKACRSDLGYNETICHGAIFEHKNDSITTEALQAATRAVAHMTAWQHPLQSGIPAIIILFVGAWSDRTGNRKALMLIPAFGQIILSFGLLLATYYFLEWPLWSTGLIESLPTALTGGFSIALMGSFSYIADVTTIESRTFRIGVVAVIVSLGLPLGTSLSGILVEIVGYYGVFAIQLVLYILGFIHTYFRIHNVRNEGTEGTFMRKLVSFFHPYNVWDTISLVIVTPLKQRIKVILVICAHVLIMGPVLGEGSVFFLYTLNRYSISAVNISLFLTYNILMGTAGTAVAVTLFSKYLKMDDSFLGIIATASKTISSLVYGLAPTLQWFFSGPVFDFFGNSGVTAIRSIGTKVVDPDKVGKMCSLIGLVEALLPVVYTPLYTQVFSNTVDTLPGAVYFLGSGMTVPAFFVFVTLYIMQRKEDRDVVKDSAAKERHAHDNDVTAF